MEDYLHDSVYLDHLTFNLAKVNVFGTFSIITIPWPYVVMLSRFEFTFLFSSFSGVIVSVTLIWITSLVWCWPFLSSVSTWIHGINYLYFLGSLLPANSLLLITLRSCCSITLIVLIDLGRLLQVTLSTVSLIYLYLG